MYHLDVKPDNVLRECGELSAADRRSGRGTLKLTDFGQAKIDDALPQSLALLAKSITGFTPRYTDARLVALLYRAQTGALDANGGDVPAVRSMLAYADVYSFGVLFWQMVTGVRPFDGLDSSAVTQRLVADPSLRPSRDTPYADGVHACWPPLIDRCWHADVALRPSIDEVCMVVYVWGLMCDCVERWYGRVYIWAMYDGTHLHPPHLSLPLPTHRSCLS